MYWILIYFLFFIVLVVIYTYRSKAEIGFCDFPIFKFSFQSSIFNLFAKTSRNTSHNTSRKTSHRPHLRPPIGDCVSSHKSVR